MKRNYSFDLLKIVLILMVICLHYMNMNMNIGNAIVDSLSMNGVLSHFIVSFCIIACNVFVMITGYYSNKKKDISIRKFVDLLLEYLFYGCCIASIYLLLNHGNSGGLSYIVKSVVDRWFIVLYIILYLLIPYINIIVNNINKKNYLLLLIILLLFFSIWPTFLTDITCKDYGYGIVNFILLYLIGAYLFKNPISKKNKNIIILLGFVSLFVTTALSFRFQRAWNYNSVFVIIQSVATFVIFKDINISKFGGLIKKISSCSLAVYLIHENTLISSFIFQTIFKSTVYKMEWYSFINMIITVICVFISCCIIEIIRQLLFKHTINKLLDKITVLNKKVEVK